VPELSNFVVEMAFENKKATSHHVLKAGGRTICCEIP